MREEIIKNLHSIGSDDVKDLLEEEFPEVFSPEFSVEEYLRNIIVIGDKSVPKEGIIEFRVNGEWALDFLEYNKEFRLNEKHFFKILEKSPLNLGGCFRLCTILLNEITGWDANTTSASSCETSKLLV